MKYLIYISIFIIFIIIIRLIDLTLYGALHKYYFFEKPSQDIEIVKKYNINPHQKKIISVSLFGKNNFYFNSASKMLDDIPVYFPGWTLRIYIHYLCDPNIIKQFIEKGAQIVVIKQDDVTPSDCTFWRFLVAQDDVIFICRDVDYQLNREDYELTEKWIREDNTNFFKYIFFFHYPVFVYNVAVKLLGNGFFAAGRWGGRNRCVPDMLDQINNFKKRRHWHSDEVFLQNIVNEKYVKNQGISVFLQNKGKDLRKYFQDDKTKLHVLPDTINLDQYDFNANREKNVGKLFEYYE